MPRLYCEPHGQEDEARVIERREEYRQEGESVLIVVGSLRSGLWLCDRCNETIDRGSVAYLVTGLPRWITESEPRYDFAYERRYFGGQYDRIAVYGAEWPGIPTATGAGFMPSRRSSRQRQRPLCALDLRPKQAEPSD